MKFYSEKFFQDFNQNIINRYSFGISWFSIHPRAYTPLGSPITMNANESKQQHMCFPPKSLFGLKLLLLQVMGIIIRNKRLVSGSTGNIERCAIISAENCCSTTVSKNDIASKKVKVTTLYHSLSYYLSGGTRHSIAEKCSFYEI